MLRNIAKKAKVSSLPKPLTFTQRDLQSAKRIGKQGFFDSLGGVYDHPDYLLAVKPYEWRDGNLKYYTTDHIGMIICIAVCALPIFLALFGMVWYSTMESHITFFNRSNIHPNLNVHNGVDARKEVNPLFETIKFLGWTSINVRTLFYHEIEAALASKAAKK